MQVALLLNIEVTVIQLGGVNVHLIIMKFHLVMEYVQIHLVYHLLRVHFKERLLEVLPCRIDLAV